MSHCIGYETYSYKTWTPTEIFADLDEFAYDPEESCGYHGNLKFHTNHIYNNYEEAIEAISNLDKGWYDDHAVLFQKDGEVYYLVKYEYHT